MCRACLMPVDRNLNQASLNMVLIHSAGHECCGGPCLVFSPHACFLQSHLRSASASCPSQPFTGGTSNFSHLCLKHASAGVSILSVFTGLLCMYETSEATACEQQDVGNMTSSSHNAGGISQSGRVVTLFGDTVEKLCCHPAYRLLSLRSLPQMPPGSIDFTTFTWPAILRRLRQMQITGELSASTSVAAISIV